MRTHKQIIEAHITSVMIEDEDDEMVVDVWVMIMMVAYKYK